jgi:hypothetical protein
MTQPIQLQCIPNPYLGLLTGLSELFLVIMLSLLGCSQLSLISYGLSIIASYSTYLGLFMVILSILVASYWNLLVIDYHTQFMVTQALLPFINI